MVPDSISFSEYLYTFLAVRLRNPELCPACWLLAPVFREMCLYQKAIVASLPAFQQSRRCINTSQPQASTTLTLMVFIARC